ncbi:DUF680 domain-containing protein [Mesorhizobium sp. dw_380]|uniref:DUF680 domain-containing protein n=1 Tax=Mesorhizobium sp. dw_380 TaxID=2812001 RepID=UPI001BDE3942|nr:DUF680 domain-containing protein [Mesorhizobium sp. dw_380]
MKKLTTITKAIALAAASLVATGAALAGSENYGSNQPVATSDDVDSPSTASIGELFTSEQSADSTTVQTQSAPHESGQGIWGR